MESLGLTQVAKLGEGREGSCLGLEKELGHSRLGKELSWPHSFTPCYQYCVADKSKAGIQACH